jgi:hypothetical protein
MPPPQFIQELYDEYYPERDLLEGTEEIWYLLAKAVLDARSASAREALLDMFIEKFLSDIDDIRGDGCDIDQTVEQWEAAARAILAEDAANLAQVMASLAAQPVPNG